MGARRVMFYSHSCGLTTRSGGTGFQYEGKPGAHVGNGALATNYRLGRLGYLHRADLGDEEYASSGNQSLLTFGSGEARRRR